MDIISKFTIASEEGLRHLFSLRKTQYTQQYQETVNADNLTNYITTQLDAKEAILELNNLSTQMLSVFVKEEPVGYVLIKQTPSPEILKDLKVINYAPFYISADHNNAEVRDSLWNKSLSLVRNYDAIWTEVLQSDPLIPSLEQWGFKVEEQSMMAPFGKPSYIMIRRKSNV
ncbi:hypothetical protein HX017_17190 [Myroides marinus]|uniref:N-acetyltransferase domain-containing protein n=1 Tax=Myroides marinus TaxID=703342 RepID=A0A1H6TS04_9FLAO|nr:hypothetical protein [Myroides marinus]KUF38204.1 hypothetical protein AS361_08120 [Myroides marinus]MDM1348686.1 hypothetical protein [Myroides marinus]MDM1352508.1 hypothetical protein [Myroides marinus]MDM1355854.1 hypothetical protein [Myroides marinus]MDM1359713.1 hypothetical protein [Myroides marinus]